MNSLRALHVEMYRTVWTQYMHLCDASKELSVYSLQTRYTWCKTDRQYSFSYHY